MITFLSGSLGALKYSNLFINPFNGLSASLLGKFKLSSSVFINVTRNVLGVVSLFAILELGSGFVEVIAGSLYSP